MIVRVDLPVLFPIIGLVVERVVELELIAGVTFVTVDTVDVDGWSDVLDDDRDDDVVRAVLIVPLAVEFVQAP